jgi:hypothetical protein
VKRRTFDLEPIIWYIAAIPLVPFFAVYVAVSWALDRLIRTFPTGGAE